MKVFEAVGGCCRDVEICHPSDGQRVINFSEEPINSYLNFPKEATINLAVPSQGNAGINIWSIPADSV